MIKVSAVFGCALFLFGAAVSRASAAEAVTLAVDASQASRGIAYVHERFPVHPGSLTLVYPKWIPGEHGPTGPLSDLAALRVGAVGDALGWHRDPIDLYAFHVSVPPGTTTLDVDFDVLLNADADTMSTRSLAIINWNRVLLYEDGVNAHDYLIKPSITLPAGWDFATALRDPVRSDNRIDFAETTLATLVDSPLDMGRYVKKWDLWKDGDAYVQLDAFADYPSALDISPDLLEAYQRVPGEAFALYGSRHFADYHALVTLSDEIPFNGIEHHQSSDNRAAADFLTAPDQALALGDLITHEFSHSWNGKYRRPADLTTPNFQVPQLTDLLWVYEGMNQYLGDLLSFRAGIRRPDEYPEYLASIYAALDYETGRSATPLIDITTGAPHYYVAHGSYGAIRRAADDFYNEGELVWLDADTIIRERSGGKKSLDTFLHRYSEPALTPPIVVTYTRSQIETLLDEVQPYDWHAFFDKYVYHIAPHPPSDEIARAGWRLVYNDRPNKFESAAEWTGDFVDHWYDLGAQLSGGRDDEDERDAPEEPATVTDVRDGSAAWKAGLAIDMQIVAVNNRAYSREGLNGAIRQAQRSNTPISLLVKQTDWFQTVTIDYHDGLRFPHLERIGGAPDMLSQIMAPHTKT
jgi:predicted metalloprotease with PDZ domain